MALGSRDILLIERRKLAIIDKFNYLYNQKRLRYDYVLYLLRWDYFFLRESQLHRILRQSGAYTTRFKVKNTKTKDGKTAPQVRNEKLRYRFNELTEAKKMRTDDAIELLRSEFFLSSTTINHILSEYEAYKNPDNNPQTKLKLD